MRRLFIVNTGRPSVPIRWRFENDCIRITSHKPNQEGYAQFKRGGRKIRVSNEIAKRFKGLTEGLCARHSCDNRWCVNPDHISSGTWAENNRDRMIRGRSATGIRSGRYKHGRAVASRRKQYKSEWYFERKRKNAQAIS